MMLPTCHDYIHIYKIKNKKPTTSQSNEDGAFDFQFSIFWDCVKGTWDCMKKDNECDGW